MTQFFEENLSPLLKLCEGKYRKIIVFQINSPLSSKLALEIISAFLKRYNKFPKKKILCVKTQNRTFVFCHLKHKGLRVYQNQSCTYDFEYLRIQYSIVVFIIANRKSSAQLETLFKVNHQFEKLEKLPKTSTLLEDRELDDHYLRGLFCGDGFLNAKRCRFVLASEVNEKRLLLKLKQTFPSGYFDTYSKSKGVNFTSGVKGDIIPLIKKLNGKLILPKRKAQFQKLYEHLLKKDALILKTPDKEAQEILPTENAWVSGFFDRDGSIFLTSKLGAIIKFTQICKVPLEYIQKGFPNGTVRERYRYIYETTNSEELQRWSRYYEKFTRVIVNRKLSNLEEEVVIEVLNAELQPDRCFFDYDWGVKLLEKCGVLEFENSKLIRIRIRAKKKFVTYLYQRFQGTIPRNLPKVKVYSLDYYLSSYKDFEPWYNYFNANILWTFKKEKVLRIQKFLKEKDSGKFQNASNYEKDQIYQNFNYRENEITSLKDIAQQKAYFVSINPKVVATCGFNTEEVLLTRIWLQKFLNAVTCRIRRKCDRTLRLQLRHKNKAPLEYIRKSLYSISNVYERTYKEDDTLYRWKTRNHIVLKILCHYSEYFLFEDQLRRKLQRVKYLLINENSADNNLFKNLNKSTGLNLEDWCKKYSSNKPSKPKVEG